ncbi:uncharacterized protein J3R85_001405 [Psidium guajava]|nr:uncharacterized protein J3R85_001405 [Psidium guajava]
MPLSSKDSQQSYCQGKHKEKNNESISTEDHVRKRVALSVVST